MVEVERIDKILEKFGSRAKDLIHWVWDIREGWRVRYTLKIGNAYVTEKENSNQEVAFRQEI